MHHYDNELNHYCPTGFRVCNNCAVIETDPAPSCFLWGEQAESMTD